METIFDMTGENPAEKGDVLMVALDHDAACENGVGQSSAMLNPIYKVESELGDRSFERLCLFGFMEKGGNFCIEGKSR